MEEERERARKVAEAARLQEEEKEETARKQREEMRLAAREELRKCRESTSIKPNIIRWL